MELNTLDITRTSTPAAKPETDEAFNLWVLLQQAKDAVYNARDKELSQYGISPREAATLRAITMIGKSATPTKLAEWVYRRPPTILGILRRMQKKGLLKLTKDVKVRNVVRISLTPRGKRIYEDAKKRESLHSIFISLDEKTYRQLELGLIQVRDNALKLSGDTIHRPFP